MQVETEHLVIARASSMPGIHQQPTCGCSPARPALAAPAASAQVLLRLPGPAGTGSGPLRLQHCPGELARRQLTTCACSDATGAVQQKPLPPPLRRCTSVSRCLAYYCAAKESNHGAECCDRKALYIRRLTVFCTAECARPWSAAPLPAPLPALPTAAPAQVRTRCLIGLDACPAR